MRKTKKKIIITILFFIAIMLVIGRPMSKILLPLDKVGKINAGGIGETANLSYPAVGSSTVAQVNSSGSPLKLNEIFVAFIVHP